MNSASKANRSVNCLYYCHTNISFSWLSVDDSSCTVDSKLIVGYFVAVYQ